MRAFALLLLSCASTPPKPAPPICGGADCVHVGLELADTNELVKARDAFRTGCDASFMESCSALALMYAQGTGGPKDEAMAARLSEKSCGADDAGGCLLHGLLARDGQGIPKDTERARADLDKACRRGLETACAARDAIPSP